MEIKFRHCDMEKNAYRICAKYNGAYYHNGILLDESLTPEQAIHIAQEKLTAAAESWRSKQKIN